MRPVRKSVSPSGIVYYINEVSIKVLDTFNKQVDTSVISVSADSNNFTFTIGFIELRIKETKLGSALTVGTRRTSTRHRCFTL